jgi:alpha-L-fucosidase
LEINFGPNGDGTLPTSMTLPLLGTGRWLAVNGEAIYASRPFPFGKVTAACENDSAAQGPINRCFTHTSEGVYALYLNWPAIRVNASSDARSITLENLAASRVYAVTLLGTGLSFEHRPVGAAGVQVNVPSAPPDVLRCMFDQCHAFVFKFSTRP